MSKHTKRVVRNIRRSVDSMEKHNEDIADFLEEVEHVPEKTVAHYRGRGEMCDKIAGGLNEALDKYDE